MKHHCHIQCTVIQRSRGHSALRRLAYQSCGYVNDGARRADYREYVADHRGSVTLLPEGAPAKFARLAHLIPAIVAAETRADAQEGRTLDFAIPRTVPDRLLLPIAAFVVAPLASMGMVVRIDIECPSASDGGLNPHGHCYLSQRVLKADGSFGKKGREWDRLFRRDSGRYVRALIAGRLTLACAILGIANPVDPRRNDEAGAGRPEERLSPVLWRKHNDGKQVDEIQSLNARRRAKTAVKSEGMSSQKQVEGFLLVSSAVPFPKDAKRRAAVMKMVAAWARARNIPVKRASSPEYRLRFGSSELTFDGATFRVPPDVGPREAALVIRLVRALEWPALVVDGDAVLADLIVVAGASEGLAAINRPASPAALALLALRQFDDFCRQIALHDPSGQVVASLEGFAPTTPVMRLVQGRRHELEVLPERQVREKLAAHRQNADVIRDHARQREKLDNLVREMAKRRINKVEVGTTRRKSSSTGDREPDFLRCAQEAFHEAQILEPPAAGGTGLTI